MKLNWFSQYVCLALLFMVTSCQVSEVEAAGLIEQFSIESGSWVSLDSPIVRDMAINESEILALRVRDLQGKAFKINMLPLDASDITFCWYPVMRAEAGMGEMDVLEEPDASGIVPVQSAKSQFVLKATVPPITRPGTYRWTMQVLVNGMLFYTGEVRLVVYPVKLGKPGINLQGNLLFKRGDVSEEVILALLEKMRAYDFNSLVLPRRFFDQETFGRVGQYVLDNFEFLRVAPRILFSRKKVLAERLQADTLTKQQWLQEECSHLATSLAWLKSRAHPHNTFIYKLWDEPMPENYNEVAYSYGGIRRCTPGVKLELTEEPSSELGDIADIWTVNINKLSNDAVQRARHQNDSIYLYANYLHEITDNPMRIRNIGWLMGYFGLDGYHFWSIANWDKGAFVQEENETGREERGTLFYWDQRTKRVLPSMRMEVFHDGLDDMQLLRQVQSCAATNTSVAVRTQASQLLEKVETAVYQWDFNDKHSQVPNLAVFKAALLKVATICHKAI
jgi:hypothetical protein